MSTAFTEVYSIILQHGKNLLPSERIVINQLLQDRALQKVRETIHVGSRVSWLHKRREVYHGTVIKVCVKNVKVREDKTKGIWVVPPTLLQVESVDTRKGEE